jgi:hypothetical protein
LKRGNEQAMRVVWNQILTAFKLDQSYEENRKRESSESFQTCLRK